MRTRRPWLVGITLWSATLIARQAPTPAALPAAVRTHVQNGRFDVVSSIRGLPLGVRGELQNLFGSGTLDIAEPGAAFQATGATSDRGLPIRRLVAAACTYEDCLVYYERGGRAHTWRVALFHWTPNATTLEFAGAAPGTLTTIDQIRSALLSGTIKRSDGPW